jgi:SAM-dependent methyltransferase
VRGRTWVILAAMTARWFLNVTAAAIGLCLVAADGFPQVVIGQDGKDVVYLPTPAPLVEAMLDLAGVTPRDYVVDLGSGDGRIVIAAARRGARSLGIEYDTNLVSMSEANAVRAGVNDRAAFVEADLFETDFSQASVVTTFLLSEVMLRLRPRLLELAPGSRIVSNSFTMAEWTPDDTVTLESCTTWCTAHLWIVPARIAGTWKMPQGELTLRQEFQIVSGSLASRGVSVPVTVGRLRGDEITFAVGSARYKGRVKGELIEGTVTDEAGSRSWRTAKTTGLADSLR